jgi:hypothetical protein
MPKRAKVEPVETELVDTLVPDPRVAEEFGVTLMSLWRWDRDPQLIALGWPPPINIRGRNSRSRRLLEAFKQAMLRRAIAERGGTKAAQKEA